MPSVKITYFHPDTPSATSVLSLDPMVTDSPERLWEALCRISGCHVRSVQFVLSESELKNRWRIEVAQGETLLGFADWKSNRPT